MPPFVLFLSKFATFTHYLRYSLISCTAHPTKGRLASFVNIVLDIVNSYKLFLGTTYQSVGASFQSLFLNHLHVLFLSLSSIPLLSMHSFCSQLIFSLFIFVSLCVMVLLFLTATINSSILFLTYQPRPFSSPFTLFYRSISPFPPFFLETYSRATSLLGYSSLFVVLSVLHFLQFILIPLKHSSTIPQDGDCPSV